MSVPNRRKRRRKGDRSALQIAEEAFHLLRSVDLRYYWIFYLGAVPFGVLLLYFTADMSRSGLADRNILATSLVLALACLGMRICQARFCEGLWETISPLDHRTGGRWSRARQTAALVCFQAFQVPLVLVGLFFVIPLGWIVAALQNSVVLAYTREPDERPLRGLVGESFRLSHRDWAQNHGVLLLFGVVALFTWVNLIATAITVPTLVKAFFGVESVFTISPNAAVMNSTFFLGVLILTHLVISPMLKAAYVLRCFYAESRVTGADLLSRLADCRRRREREEPRRLDSGSSSRAALVALGLFCLAATGAGAEGAPESPRETVVSGADQAELGTVNQDELREQITETLEQKKYQWQLSRRTLEAESEEEASWLKRRVREIADSSREAIRKFSKWLREAFERLERSDRGQTRPSSNGDSALFNEISSTLSIGLIVLVSGLVAWLVLVMYRKFKGATPVEGEEVVAESIDLQSEDIVATQLPEDEWMKLAREQIEKGDGRLAIRALFLATLANLGEVGLLRIARFKTNRVYREELQLRARKNERLREAFAENIRLFERTWYGRHSVPDALVEDFLRNYEIIAGESRRSAAPDPANLLAST